MQDNILHLVNFNKMELSRRIRMVVDYSGKSIPKYADAIGLQTPQGIRDLISGKTKTLSEAMRNKILSYMPDLNASWLLAGEGEMLKSAIDMGSSSTSIVPNKPFRTYFKEENVRMVPLLNIDSVGGMHSSNEVGEYEPEFILDMLPFKGAIQGDVAIKETGDSMSPRIPSGAIMLLRRVMEWQEYFGYGHVFVLVLTDGRRITKRVTKCIENPREYVLCESINPAYPSEELPKKMIYSVWKVIDVLVHEGY